MWDPSTFGKNRDRLLAGDFAAAFLTVVPETKEVKPLPSHDPFSVDGTLIQARASTKSFRRKDGQDAPPSPGRHGERDLRKNRPANEPHASTTDPDARLHRKGKGREARPSFIGRLLMGNGNGLIVDAALTRATGRAEPEAALAMPGERPGNGRVTAGADKARDAAGFVAGARDINVTPHASRNINAHRGSNIDARHAPTRPPDQPGDPETDRGSQRLDQGGRRDGPCPVPRP